MRSFVTAAFVIAAFARHSAAAFTCDGGKTIPDANVGDDYCDCEDGSDEAEKTGACPNTLFRCESKPHQPTKIFASRVNDGVCDCCDGADEYARPAGAPACPNTCVELAKVELARSSRASLLRAEREASGREAAVSRQKRLAAARDELSAGAAKYNAAEAAKVAAEALESGRRLDRETRLAKGEVAAALKLGELSTEQLGVALARLAISKQVEGADALHEKMAGMAELSEAMEDVDSADLIEIAMEAKEATAEGAEGSPVACAEEAAACGFEPSFIKLLPLASLSQDGVRDLLRSFAEESAQVAELAKIAAALLRGAGGVVDEGAVAAAIALLEPFRDEAADAARAACSALEADKGKHEATIAELDPVQQLEPQFGSSQEWHALHANCYTSREGVFEYRLCPFDSFTQDGRSLGKYEGWQTKAEGTAAHVMGFGAGEECDGKKPRRASVIFECGEEDRLQAVTEPSTCVYEARFTTPSACSTSQVIQQHEALAAEAKAAGLAYEPDEAVRKILSL